MTKERLDKLLVSRGFFPSREKARDAITHRTVKVNGLLTDKPSKLVDEDVTIEIVDIFNRYVSRGGLKLEKAIVDFGLNFMGKRVLDLGASTGGFTDCALEHGASICYCVDVGRDQLHETLRMNPRVKSIERKDFRELELDNIDNLAVDYIVADLSFISLTFLFPHIRSFLKEDGEMLLLIKPQFEAGVSFLNKSGVVTDGKAYKIAIQKIISEAVNCGFHLQNIAISTLFETNKNVEFLALFSSKDSSFAVEYPRLLEEVKNVKKSLKKKNESVDIW